MKHGLDFTPAPTVLIDLDSMLFNVSLSERGLISRMFHSVTRGAFLTEKLNADLLHMLRSLHKKNMNILFSTYVPDRIQLYAKVLERNQAYYGNIVPLVDQYSLITMLNTGVVTYYVAREATDMHGPLHPHMYTLDGFLAEVRG